MLHIVRKPVDVADTVFVGIFGRLVDDVVCEIVCLPQPVPLYDPEVHRMTDKLVTVILVAQGGNRYLFRSERFPDIEMDIPLLLLDTGKYAVQILTRSLYIFLRPGDQQLTRLEYIARLNLVRNTHRYDIEVLEIFPEIGCPAHVQHLQQALLRNVCPVFRPSLALCEPDGAFLFRDVQPDILGEHL